MWVEIIQSLLPSIRRCVDRHGSADRSISVLSFRKKHLGLRAVRSATQEGKRECELECIHHLCLLRAVRLQLCFDCGGLIAVRLQRKQVAAA